MRLTNLAIRQSTTVFIMILIVGIMGMNAYFTLPKEAAPEIQIPVVIISTPYFGVASKDIETLITVPIEKKLKELSDVKEISSTSAESASAITIEFEPTVNIDDALQKVREKVDLAKPDLPKDAEESAIIEINFSDQPIMIVNLGSDEGLVKLKKIGEDLQDDIEQIQGILDVDLVGSLEREIKVMVDAERLKYYNLSFNSVINAIRNENINIPGGSIDIGNLKYLVRVPGEFTSINELRSIVIKNPKNTNDIIYLRDVARVIDGYKDQNTFARLNDRQSLSLSVKKRAGENILFIADTVTELTKTYGEKYPNTNFTITADQSQFVRDLFSDMQNNMITSIILVFIVLFFTLGWMNASFVGMAIPLSMLITFATLQIIDIKLNMIVLFSLIIALGMLVDNSLVIVENAYRLMQEGIGKIEASKRSAQELGFPLISSTLTTLGAFLPLLFWPGIMGEFMGYLPKVLIIALSASLFVAIVINPVFSAIFMKVKNTSPPNKDEEPKSKFIQKYVQLLKVSLRFKYVTVAGMVVMFFLTIFAYTKLGAGVMFFSKEEPAVATVDIRLPEGTKVAVTNKVAKKVEKIIGKYAEGNIEYVITNVGSSGSGEGPMGGGGSGSGYSHRSAITIDFLGLNERKDSSKEVLEKIRTELQDIVGAKFEIKEQSNGPPTGAPLSVEIIGEDLKVLGRLTEEVKKLVETVPGVVDLKDNYNTGKPEIKITVDREKASLFKLNTSSIANTVRTAVNGTKASNYRELDEEYDITVRIEESQRANLSDIMDLTIANKDDEPIPISMVARVETTSGLGSIRRKDSKRTITVSSNVTKDHSSNEVVAATRKLLDEKMKMPPGYLLNFAGESQDQAESGAFLSRAFLVAVMLIFMVLVTQFNSLVLPGIILSTVILSIMGVLMGLMVTQSPFSIVLTGIGVISLAGIVVNNGIVLIDYIQMLRKEGYEAMEAVVKAGTVRIRPVLLTATTTILGLLPTALGINIDFANFTIGKAGESSQLWFSMAVAIISGLTVSTILTLFFVPCMYLIIENMRDFTKRMMGKVFKSEASEETPEQREVELALK